jgi:hypothetical protein
MKTIKKLTGLVLIALLISFVSCQKEELNQNELINQNISETKSQEVPEVQVIDETLHFRDIKSFISVTDYLGALNDDLKDNWEDQLEFRSLRSHLNNLYTLVENAKGESTANRIINDNTDLIYEEDNMLKEVIPSGLYQSISNRDGIFYVNGTIHKLYKNKIYTSLNNSIDDINNVIFGNINENDDVRSSIYIDEESGLETRSTCNGADGQYTSSNYRRIKARIKAYRITLYDYYGNRAYQFVNVERRSESYKKSWGKYRPRNAHHHRKEIQYTVRCPINQLGSGPAEYGWVTETFWSNNNGGYRKTYTQWKRSGVYIQVAFNNNYSINIPYFSSLQGKFNTKGSNGVEHWMSITCN